MNATLLDGLSDIDGQNVVRCARVLLRRPLLHPDTPDGDLLPLIYRHKDKLQEMFTELLGYRLVVERRFARLYKAGPGRDATRGESTLTPRGYAYLALSIAVLTAVGRQILLSRLVAEIRSAATEAGMTIVDDRDDRRALTAALRHLVQLGVITETEGTVTEATGEALITIDTDLLGQLITGPLAEATGPGELVALAARPGPRGLDHSVRRKLIEDPVVLHSGLTADESTWLRKNQRREALLLERYFGMVSEIRQEGVAVCDPEEYLTDIAFPGLGTVARMTLLALPELLRQSEPGQDGRVPISTEQIRATCADLVEDYPSAWSKQAVSDEDSLVKDMLALMTRLGLITRDHIVDGGWLLNPVAHRWLPEPDAAPGPDPDAVEPEPVQQGPSLFDDDDAESLNSREGESAR
ncbi:TIGR02678 family protein [Pseudonocardiaceae bacterium YIM PH 21723]|nr:TIGR02678 family protein [Pseudonocardiaceae bacterium YIM PH 21723]